MTGQSISPFPAKRLKDVVLLRRSQVDGSDDRPYIGLENIESWTGKRLRDSTATEVALSDLVKGTSIGNSFEPGDVLFGKLRPYLAKAWVAEFPGRSTTEFLIMHPVEIEPRFLRYVCLSRDFVETVDASTFGSKMPRADWNFIGNISIPVPEWCRQCAIADYLDRETARLDALVATKEQVLGLLAEKRRALITRTVTGNLDPCDQHSDEQQRQRPLRDQLQSGPLQAHATTTARSDQHGTEKGGGVAHALVAGGDGVIGQSVSSFPTKRLKSVVLLRRSQISGSDDRPYIGLENIESWTGKRLCNSTTTAKAALSDPVKSSSLGSAFETGDVLFGKLRPYLAKVWVAEFPGRSTTEFLVMHPVEVESRFLRYVCLSTNFVETVDASTFGSKMPRAEWGFIGNISVPVPGWCCQRAIADYLDYKTARLDALISTVEQSIVLFKERRTALITATVSGQIEIRSSTA